ncbi:hypothetical protein DM01DRAFT_1337987 [Hesseltinella vesiculosa]|uniref:Uncharacterized protein n=1 Tax=Hesseltinella vesiculosa TaxID=101127 RepID=A0A1X2GBE9_9FUNG|nr:hypothetical protein DM01DRAFT_1337987 [Hesseltinella vesiculosa]
MDLNICLYCEKPMMNDNLSFCSKGCELSESTKQLTSQYSNSYASLSTQTTTSSVHALPPSPSTYELSYHRRPSFSYTHSMKRRPSNGASSSSSYDSLSSTLSFDSSSYLQTTPFSSLDTSFP